LSDGCAIHTATSRLGSLNGNARRSTSVDNGEDRRCGADAKRDREDRKRGEQRTSSQEADGERDVSCDLVDDPTSIHLSLSSASDGAAFVHDARHVSDLCSRDALRLVK
jgi:hypothetical protein